MKTSMNPEAVTTEKVRTSSGEQPPYANLREATPKFAFNMRILAVKDGEHPRSHSIKEELPTATEANEHAPSSLQAATLLIRITARLPSVTFKACTRPCT